MVEITSENGKDPTDAIVTELEASKKSLVRDAADLWYQESIDWLTEAAERRSQLGERHGRAGREQTGLFAISKHSIQPFWDASKEEWIFGFPHEGAIFQEFGALPHEIRAKKAEVLAFEWPDAPEEVKEQFSHTEGDLVFFESIDHPGIPAIGFVRYGKRQAKRYLEQQGHEVEGWTES